MSPNLTNLMKPIDNWDSESGKCPQTKQFIQVISLLVQQEGTDKESNFLKKNVITKSVIYFTNVF